MRRWLSLHSGLGSARGIRLRAATTSYLGLATLPLTWAAAGKHTGHSRTLWTAHLPNSLPRGKRSGLHSMHADSATACSSHHSPDLSLDATNHCESFGNFQSVAWPRTPTKTRSVNASMVGRNLRQPEVAAGSDALLTGLPAAA